MTRPASPLLRGYLAASRAIPLVAPALLRHRLARGKEFPSRWREKLGEPSLPRPDGPVIWLHAVGLGETLALRGLITAMAAQSGAAFLVTSTTRGSAEVFAANLPPRTRHQFLPLDAPSYLGRFLDHWRPDLSIWAEQDMWPGALAATFGRGIPLALVNARMNGDAFARRKRYRGLYADLFGRFSLVAAQDASTAANLTALGAVGVRVLGSLKAGSPPLSADPAALTQAEAALAGRRAVLLASSHLEDEDVALTALSGQGQPSLLLIAPRDITRGSGIAEAARARGFVATQRSRGDGPSGDVWVVDTVGEMGIWYRLCPTALIGGSFGPTEGHNPWEAAALGSAILHGPRVANFATDYAQLAETGGTRQVDHQTLASALMQDHTPMAARARLLAEQAQDGLGPLAEDLLDLAGLR